MVTDLVELAADIVSSHVSVTEMSSDDLIKELKLVYATLEELEQGKVEIAAPEPVKRGRKAQKPLEPIAEEEPAAPPAPAMSILEAFKPDHVGCIICGKRGMKTLKRHLATAHNLKPAQYRKQFNIPKEQPLAAAEYVAVRRKIALDRGLGDKLAAARAAKKAGQAAE